MAGTTEPTGRGTPDRASEWLVALGEAPDDPDLHARFEAWLAADPAHAVDWDEMSRTLMVMGLTPPLHRAEWSGIAARRAAGRAAALSDGSTPATIALRPRRPTALRAGGRHPSVSRRFWKAATAAIAAGLVLALFPDLWNRLQADHRTGTAQVQTVRLDDGSVVRLAPESAIDVTFTSSRRHVRLLGGEAFFEVAQDLERPFVVAARGIETTDIGTAFNVRNAEDGADIAVRDGIVEVDGAQSGPSVHERLSAGERARVTWTGAVERGRLPPEQVAAWLQGQLVVKHRPVAEIVDALRPYFRGLIVVHGESLARQPLTGVYSLSRPADALAAVAAAQGATLYRISPWLLVLARS